MVLTTLTNYVSDVALGFLKGTGPNMTNMFAPRVLSHLSHYSSLYGLLIGHIARGQILSRYLRGPSSKTPSQSERSSFNGAGSQVIASPAHPSDDGYSHTLQRRCLEALIAREDGDNEVKEDTAHKEEQPRIP
ncbi:hypothetical protein RRG08_029855 [Elysia crispata]|uniref:Uncharacterized protein n=1 Tax=Elysia crispata TaxID=231223 RepID=A0AAE0YL62_9GAST|nr:hypothetical protein RRG08_029855 [Elysia crispata]